jgi:hypothetical protein
MLNKTRLLLEGGKIEALFLGNFGFRRRSQLDGPLEGAVEAEFSTPGAELEAPSPAASRTAEFTNSPNRSASAKFVFALFGFLECEF